LNQLSIGIDPPALGWNVPDIEHKQYDKVTETIELVLLFSLCWKNLEAHCFHSFLTDSPTKQSKNSENSELPDSSKTVKIAKTVLWS